MVLPLAKIPHLHMIDKFSTHMGSVEYRIQYVHCYKLLTWEMEEERLQEQQVKPVENLDVKLWWLVSWMTVNNHHQTDQFII